MDQEEVGTNNPIVKGKRTKRSRPQFASDQDPAGSSESYSAATAAAAATPSHRVNTEEEEDMANCLIMLAQGRRFNHDPKFTSRRFLESPAASGSPGYYVYECKTCSKTFPSFQALGGHRASHKKPKIALPTKDKSLILSDEDETAAGTPPVPISSAPTTVIMNSNSLSLQLTNRALYNTTPKQRVHECSICGAEFGSGQALGGHMRRHRGPTATGGIQTPAPSLSLTIQEEEKRSPSTSSAVDPTFNSKKKLSLDLDLNLPAMPDTEEVNASSESKLIFAGKKSDPEAQQLVFSPPPALVDCHY